MRGCAGAAAKVLAGVAAIVAVTGCANGRRPECPIGMAESWRVTEGSEPPRVLRASSDVHGWRVLSRPTFDGTLSVSFPPAWSMRSLAGRHGEILFASATKPLGLFLGAEVSTRDPWTGAEHRLDLDWRFALLDSRAREPGARDVRLNGLRIVVSRFQHMEDAGDTKVLERSVIAETVLPCAALHLFVPVVDPAEVTDDALVVLATARCCAR